MNSKNRPICMRTEMFNTVLFTFKVILVTALVARAIAHPIEELRRIFKK